MWVNSLCTIVLFTATITIKIIIQIILVMKLRYLIDFADGKTAHGNIILKVNM